LFLPPLNKNFGSKDPDKMPASKDKIVIFGMGGYAKVTADAALAEGRYEIAAFIDRTPAATSCFGIPIIAEKEYFATPLTHKGIVAVGDNALREKIVGTIMTTKADFEFVNAVHPRAIVSPFAKIGVGCVLLAGAIVNPDARLGNHVSLYTNAIVEHDDAIDDYVTLAPAAGLGGHVSVGARSFIGLGATVNHGLVLGCDVVVGAGTAVIENASDGSVVMGVPGKIVRTRQKGDQYL
jgi:sugar O-acyltransferase (sialic acid O-acetyltransferase NeuD family)